MIECPDIDWRAPKAEIRWTSTTDPKRWFVITIEDFLVAAKTTNSEAAFRAQLYTMGQWKWKDGQNRRRKTA